MVKPSVKRVYALDDNGLYGLEQKAVDYGFFSCRLYDTRLFNVSFYRAGMFFA